MTFRGSPLIVCFTFVGLTFAGISAGCSGSSERKSVIFRAGDKASVEKVTYSVVDSQILPHLGDDANPRMPKSRFYVVQLSISNGGGTEAPIPGMVLIDDAGKTYGELTDGTGVQRWLGISRRVAANQTETGSVVFDAPAGHYKLRVTDETDPSDVFIDLPLSFAHEQMQNDAQSTSEAVGGSVVAPTPPVQKK
jgi:hypothetical protein